MKGIIIRIVIGIILAIFPVILCVLLNDKGYLFFYCLVLPFTVFLVVTSSECSKCDCCILSTKCENSKKSKIVKKFMSFIGYDNNIIKNLEYNVIGYNKKYILIFKDLKSQYNEYKKANEMSNEKQNMKQK